MAFIETKKVKNKSYYYLAKSIRKEGKVKKQRLYLGVNLTDEQLGRLVKEKEITLDENYHVVSVLTRQEYSESRDIKSKIEKKLQKYEPDNYYRAFITDFTYDSNAIEGSSLTLRDTGNLLFEGISPAAKPLKHVKEAINHKEAFDFTSGYKNKLDKKFICAVQKRVVAGTQPEHLMKYEGKIRELNVRVGSHVAPDHQQVHSLLNKLLRWYYQYKDKYHVIEVCAFFHAQFEYIHPFVDGNGRTGRLILNKMLKDPGWPYMNIFFKFRGHYYSALESYQNEKNIQPLIRLFLRCYREGYKRF